MCGIAGVIAIQDLFKRESVEAALDRLTHRGPDSGGILHQKAGSFDIWLCHRRLSIIDLSEDGAQPMCSKDESIVFNGELYNFRELKDELTWEFRSNSDTEVLLAGLATQGPKRFLPKTNGMMAFALYSHKNKTISLGRDRLGKKPLYIYQHDRVFAFASELTFFEELGLSLSVSQEALAHYRWLGYVPATMSIYRECRKFPAGCFVEIELSGLATWSERIKPFWDPFASILEPSDSSLESSLQEFHEILIDSTRIRLEADVEVGAFLSGGIDSSIVVAAIAQLNADVRLFTVKAAAREFDESEVAIQIASTLGLLIEMLDLRYEDYEVQIAKIANHFDEPLADSSQIPTMAIAQAASKKTKVVLTGDGGDELFIGYPRLLYPEKLFALTEVFPNASRAVIASLLRSTPGSYLMSLALLAAGRSLDDLDTKAEIMACAFDGSEHRLHDAISAFRPLNLLAADDRNLIEQSTWDMARTHYPHYSWDNLNTLSVGERNAALDLVVYMRDDILMKVDRATMAYSLEARSPLLDHRIVEFALKLPREQKLVGGMPKGFLRMYAAQFVGEHLATLPKKGFSVPIPLDNLPPGPTLPVRWNRHVEDLWKEHRKFTF